LLVVTRATLFCPEQDFSVWPFRSRDLSVLVVSVSRNFGQTMKSCRNLIYSLFNANLLKSTKGSI